MSGLPFLFKKKPPTTVVETREPDHVEKDESNHGIKAAAQDLLQGIQDSNPDRVASALQAAFEIFDSQPHEEADHSDQESESEQGE